MGTKTVRSSPTHDTQGIHQLSSKLFMIMAYVNVYEAAFVSFYFILVINSGWCLECFVCHSKQHSDCSDPFEGNRTDLIDCQRVRDVGLGIIAASSALGAAPVPYLPLSHPPHVCFKLAIGNYLVRGCSKAEFCQNYTETDCQTCDSDGCNTASFSQPSTILPFLALGYLQLSAVIGCFYYH